MVTQRGWIGGRVVMPAIGRREARPASSVISPSRRACAAVTMPFGMRTRIMKWPGVGRRWKPPTHFSRSLSSSPSVFPPSRGKRTRSSVTSRPSFSAFIASIRFMGARHSGSCGFEPAQPHGTRLELGLARERIARAEREVVGALVEAEAATPVKRREEHARSEEHTPEFQYQAYFECRLLLEKKKK